MQEDQQSRAGLFATNQRGQLPPLVTTKFQVEDQGNASPRYIRSTMYSVPAQPDMLKQTAVPFAIVVSFCNANYLYYIHTSCPVPDRLMLIVLYNLYSGYDII